jgi:hypothetical protein
LEKSLFILEIYIEYIHFFFSIILPLSPFIRVVILVEER